MRESRGPLLRGSSQLRRANEALLRMRVGGSALPPPRLLLLLLLLLALVSGGSSTEAERGQQGRQSDALLEAYQAQVVRPGLELFLIDRLPPVRQARSPVEVVARQLFELGGRFPHFRRREGRPESDDQNRNRGDPAATAIKRPSAAARAVQHGWVLRLYALSISALYV